MASYLVFQEVPTGTKTKRMNIISATRGNVLGIIKWHGPWRQYVFVPADNTLWNRGCMDEIHAKITELMKEHAAAVRERVRQQVSGAPRV